MPSNSIDYERLCVMNCSNCSEAIQADTKFCPSCGEKVAGISNSDDVKEKENVSVTQGIGAVIGVIIAAGWMIGVFDGDDSGQPSQAAQAASAPSTTNSAVSKLVGDWYCRNASNYISKIVYTSDGRFSAYETAYRPNVRSDNMPLTYTGSYKLDGDILRVSSRSVQFGSESKYVLKITTLNDEELVKYWQNQNFYERCFKPIG